MKMPSIQIVDKPRLVSPTDVIGSALEIPLNETPDQAWLRHFKPPTDKVEVQDKLFRAWLTQAVQANPQGFLDRLEIAIKKANEAHAQEIERREQMMESHKKQAKERRDCLTEDLDQWWTKHRTAAEA